VDTYDTLASGVPNFTCVALALYELGHRPLGIRIDSGNLADLSWNSRERMEDLVGRYTTSVPLPRPLSPQEFVASIAIMASNDLNEAKLRALLHTRHALTAFGIGTELVTCRAQPALGCVFKLAALNGTPRMKLSEEPGKSTIPGGKAIFRVFQCEAGQNDDTFVADVLALTDADDTPPVAGNPFRYVSESRLRHANLVSVDVEGIASTVFPSRVECLLQHVWAGTFGAGAMSSTYGTPAYLNTTRKDLQVEFKSLKIDQSTLEKQAIGEVGLSLPLAFLMADMHGYRAT
jgi:putative nicotinate phosphoribosyltransferase